MRSIEISRGSFFSPTPKMRIGYVDPATGEVQRVEYSRIRTKELAEKFYRALIEVLGTSKKNNH
ncbi:MAG: hypothetical protein ABWW65_01085 [Thermoprotei archaeon]